MPAGTNVSNRFVALGDMDGGYDEIVLGTLPASSPLTYQSGLSSVRGVTFGASSSGVAANAWAYSVSGQVVTVHFDVTAFASLGFTLRLYGRR
jgi:hypothetical protein